MRVTAVPEVRASAICSMFLYGGASRSFHDAGALRLFSFRNLSLVMNTSGSSAMATHWPSACWKRGGQLRERRRLVRLEHAFADAGGERLDRAAEQHVDARVVLLRDHARERLARGEADEVDLDAGRLLELLEHRPRPVLGPDRVDVERVRGDAEARRAQTRAAKARAAARASQRWRDSWLSSHWVRRQRPTVTRRVGTRLKSAAVRDRPRRRARRRCPRPCCSAASAGPTTCLLEAESGVAHERAAGDRHRRAGARGECARRAVRRRDRRAQREQRRAA